jgi:hypothetical protein
MAVFAIEYFQVIFQIAPVRPHTSLAEEDERETRLDHELGKDSHWLFAERGAEVMMITGCKTNSAVHTWLMVYTCYQLNCP